MTFKVTAVYQNGSRSSPHDCEANESQYILLPDDPDAVRFEVYRSILDAGPWYFVRSVSKREARTARRTIVAPPFDPYDDPLGGYFVTFPDPQPDQEFWYLYAYERPVLIANAVH